MVLSPAQEEHRLTQQPGGPLLVDVHRKVASLPPPAPFHLDETTMTFTVGDTETVGTGHVHADLTAVGASMHSDFPAGVTTGVIDIGFVKRAIIPKERFGTLVGSGVPAWRADGVFDNHPMAGPLGTDFHVTSVTVSGPSSGPIAYTRDLFVGSRILFVLGTPEETVFDRRTTLRNAPHPGDGISCAILTYDGGAQTEAQRHATWLALSFLAGADLQPCASESFDAAGELVERTYQPRSPFGPPGYPPFSVYYAPSPARTLETFCERLHALLVDRFPIDVVIAHIHDSNSGSMERQMTSSIFAIHAASEAWNRLYEDRTIVDDATWRRIHVFIDTAASAIAALVSPALAESVKAKITNANDTSMGHRLRLFFRRVGLEYTGETKKAIELRNKLFHDGYLQKRFSDLDARAKDVQYERVLRLREFTMRMVFALCSMQVDMLSVLRPNEKIPTIDASPERRVPAFVQSSASDDTEYAEPLDAAAESVNT
jgi:hypothetical protein